MNKDRIIELLRTNRNLFEEKGISAIALFGSYSTGQETPESDIDIFVEFRKDYKTFDTFMDLVITLEDLLGKRVEVLTKESIYDDFLNFISRDMVYAY
jgi:uncharacterized protein